MIAICIGPYCTERALARIVENSADGVILKGAIRRAAVIACIIGVIAFFRTYAISVTTDDSASAIDCLISSSAGITICLITVYFMACLAFVH